MDFRDLGTTLRARRTQLGQTQRDTATLAGVTFQYVSEAERGTDKLTLRTLKAITMALDVDLNIEIRPKNDPLPLADLQVEEHALARRVLKVLGALKPGERQVGLRQLERWVEDFGQSTEVAETYLSNSKIQRREDGAKTVHPIAPLVTERPAGRAAQKKG